MNKISYFSLKHLFLNLIKTYPLGSTYLRIIVIVSFRSFPWKGSVPVSISNYKKAISSEVLVNKHKISRPESKKSIILIQTKSCKIAI